MKYHLKLVEDTNKTSEEIIETYTVDQEVFRDIVL